MPEGSELYIDGEYPYSRYMSIISYNARGKPLESLADYLIKPLGASINPFIDGNKRLNNKRDYTIQILNKEPVILTNNTVPIFENATVWFELKTTQKIQGRGSVH